MALALAQPRLAGRPAPHSVSHIFFFLLERLRPIVGVREVKQGQSEIVLLRKKRMFRAWLVQPYFTIKLAGASGIGERFGTGRKRLAGYLDRWSVAGLEIESGTMRALA